MIYVDNASTRREHAANGIPCGPLAVPEVSNLVLIGWRLSRTSGGEGVSLVDWHLGEP